MSSTPDDLLDEALRLTFPASDPVAISADSPPLRIFLVGGASALTQRIAREAIARGHELGVGGELTDGAAIARAVRGFGAVISTIDPVAEAAPQTARRASSALIEGLTRAAVRRLLIVSETGSFEEALLERYSEAGFDWTYVSPAALPGHDPREDDIVAIAVLDELEAPRHFRQRLTVAS
jgi:putative NADH-flavin reductase